MNEQENFSKLHWEVIERLQSEIDTEHGYLRTIRRAKVHGGWLVQARVEIRDTERHGAAFGQNPQTVRVTFGLGVGLGLTFVPDPAHEWLLD